MNRIDIRGLTEAQETLLMPLWSRAMESRREDPLIRDEKADEIVNCLDFDFGVFREKSVSSLDYNLRASVIDQLVRQFQQNNNKSTIVELGVGLDTRRERLDHPGTVWIELDLPEAMKVRQQFFEADARRMMISGSILDTDWFPHVETNRQGPLLFIAEGVFYFFCERQVRELLSRLAARFPESSLIFDAQSPLFLMLSNFRHPLRDSRLKFSLARAERMKSWNPGFRIEQYVGFGDSPYYDAGMPRVSHLRRWGRRLIPSVRHMFKIVHVGW